VWDDRNEEKVRAHGLSPARVDQVLDNEHVIVPNRQGRPAPYMVIGRDHGGGCIAIPVLPTNDPGEWRPITAWRCKQSEDAILS
jgi:uncharacterized DUF497 family protein